MIPIDIFFCSEKQLRSCKSWVEATDQIPCTGITIPDESALLSLSKLLTGQDTLPLHKLPNITGAIYRLSDAFIKAVEAASDDDLMEIAAKWAESAPWSATTVNSFDLAGHLLEWKHHWIRCTEPEKTIILWYETEDFQPISLSELQERVELEEAFLRSQLDPHLVEKYQQFRLTPFDSVNIKRSKDYGVEQVFVIARAGDLVLYFDDTEGEFASGRVDTSGFLFDRGLYGDLVDAIRGFLKQIAES